MDREQEITLFWMKANRRILEGETLQDCERDIKEIEEWAASGNAGLPERFNVPLRYPNPVNHKLGDGHRCERCGIEKIYWEHFPDCSRFNELVQHS